MNESSSSSSGTSEHHFEKPTYEVTWNDLNKFKYYSYGILATTATQLVFYPFDLIKTHQQVHIDGHLSQTTILRNLLKQAKTARVLYRGFGVSLAGILSAENLYMSTYEVSNQQLVEKSSMITRYLLSGFCADVIANTLVVPFDVISQRRMLSMNSSLGTEESVRGIIKDIIKKDGYKGLFRGYGLTMAKYAPESAIWWLQYGLIRNLYFNNLSSEERSAHLFKHQLTSSGLAGLVAGATSAILFNPMDVIKTRLQTNYEKLPILDIIRDLKAKEGWKGFIKGMGPNAIYMSSTSAISITIYELIKILATD